jgi:hypothetical protein
MDNSPSPALVKLAAAVRRHRKRAMDLKNIIWRTSKRSAENGGNCVEVSAIESK